MKASTLISQIRENLKDYPIDYLKNKAIDDNRPDNIFKELAKYNSLIYDEIYDYNLIEDFEIDDSIILNLKKDIDYYFSVYDPGDIETRDFTKDLALYLVFIGKKPLHPFGDNHNLNDVYVHNNTYFCKNKIKYLKDKYSLCRYCACKKVTFPFLF